MTPRIAWAVACLVLAACAAPAHLSNRFDPNEVAWFAGSGTNTIQGTAIVRSLSGAAKSCAAEPVVLFPATAYARERMRHLYGSEDEGFNPLAGGRPASFEGDDPRYLATARTNHCDARGRFSFISLPDGDYYVVVTVHWHERRGLGLDQGGYLMQRVSVHTGDTKDLLLAH